LGDLQVTFVEGYRCSGEEFDLSVDRWSFALDQRAFGPRRLLVATARGDGGLIGLAHCEQIDPPEMGLKCCIAALDDAVPAAVAYSDEPVGPEPPTGLEERFAAARGAAAQFGVHLVDWFMCDDIRIRSTRMTLPNHGDWWDLPTRLSCRPNRKGRGASGSPGSRRPSSRPSRRYRPM
jgi:hypothetical protein